MPKRRPDNTLSRRTINCLSKAGIPIERQAIIRALRSGKMFPYFWPPNYGKCTHREVCRWAGIDPATLPKHPPAHEITPYVDDGLSFRAHNCLKTAGVARTKEAVLHALQTGVLSPSRCPAGYGKVTHTEVCRWIGLRRPVILDVPYERRLCG